MPCYAIAATISDRHTAYKSGNQNDTFEVGPGNLKLVYSGIQGKLTYINNRSKVCEMAVYLHLEQKINPYKLVLLKM